MTIPDLDDLLSPSTDLDPATLSGALQLFLQRYDRVETQRSYYHCLRMAFEYLATFSITRVDEVKPFHLSRYDADLRQRDAEMTYRHRNPTPRKLSPATVARRVKALKIFFAWAEGMWLLTADGNPAKHLKPPKATRRQASEKMATDNEVDQILAVAYGDTLKYAIIMVLATTGARRGEVAKLSLDNLNLAPNNEHIIIIEGKTGQRIAGLPSATVRAIQDWLGIRPETDHRYLFCNPAWPHRGYEPRSISQMVRRLSVRAKLDRPVSPHAFRHYYATRLLRLGVDVKTVANAIGDTPKTVMEHYIHAEDQRVIDVMRRTEVLPRPASEDGARSNIVEFNRHRLGNQ